MKFFQVITETSVQTYQVLEHLATPHTYKDATSYCIQAKLADSSRKIWVDPNSSKNLDDKPFYAILWLNKNNRFRYSELTKEVLKSDWAELVQTQSDDSIDCQLKFKN